MKKLLLTFLLSICLAINTTKPVDFMYLVPWDVVWDGAKWVGGGLLMAGGLVVVPAAQGVGQEVGKALLEYWKDRHENSLPEKYKVEKDYAQAQLDQAKSTTKSVEVQTIGAEHSANQSELVSLRELRDSLPKIYKDKAEREIEEQKIIKRMRLLSNKIINEDENDKLLSEKEVEDIKKKYKKNAEKKSDKISLFSKLATYLAVIQATAGNSADFLADCSFAHITNLGCFKDTFIQVHAKNINRALVATTLVGIGFGLYKLYDKYTNADDDEYDNDKDDDDDK